MLIVGCVTTVVLAAVSRAAQPVTPDTEGTAWADRLATSDRIAEAKDLFAKLKGVKPGDGFEEQVRLYEVLDPPALSDETLATLDRLIGEGAAAEVLAQQLFRMPAFGSIRAVADHATAARLAKRGKAALPALYRLLFTEQRPPVWMAGYKHEVLWAIGEIGEPEAVDVLVRWGESVNSAQLDPVTRAFWQLGRSAVPRLVAHARHEHDSVRAAVWRAITPLTMQYPPPGRPSRSNARLEALPADATERLVRWWQRRREFFLDLPNEQLLVGEPMDNVAMAIVNVQLAPWRPIRPGAEPSAHVGLRVGEQWKGDEQGVVVARSYFTRTMVTVETPDGRKRELYHVDKEPEAIEQQLGRDKGVPTYRLDRYTSYGYGNSVAYPPPQTMTLTSMWYRQADGSPASDAFDRPGRYRVRVTLEVPPDAPGDWHGRITSPWATVWVIESDEWMW